MRHCSEWIVKLLKSILALNTVPLQNMFPSILFAYQHVSEDIWHDISVIFGSHLKRNHKLFAQYFHYAVEHEHWPPLLHRTPSDLK